MSGDRVEAITPADAALREDAWRDLCARALEPNVFAEPAFLVPALRHLAGSLRLRVLLVWRGQTDRLIGALALETPRAPPGMRVARVWRSEQAGLGALALDRDEAAPALEAVLDWLGRERPGTIGLLVPGLDPVGPTAAAILALARRRNLGCRAFGRIERAALPGADTPARGFEASLPKKRVKEWRRQLRRLAERGAVAFRIADDAAAIEDFLALEARGWKGARRTALGIDPGRAAFARAMLGAMARDGRLAVHLMTLEGAAIAAGIALRAGDRAFYWKTAFDESLAAFSPGVQLTLTLSRAQLRDATIASTDSCAIEGHPMIDRLWPGRLTLDDLVVATRPGRAAGLSLWVVGERTRRRFRDFAKRLINLLGGRKRS
jgi:CelD/BcsL family acetyltransferase involved in cellulose biosynthesis